MYASRKSYAIVNETLVHYAEYNTKAALAKVLNLPKLFNRFHYMVYCDSDKQAAFWCDRLDRFLM